MRKNKNKKISIKSSIRYIRDSYDIFRQFPSRQIPSLNMSKGGEEQRKTNYSEVHPVCIRIFSVIFGSLI